MCHSEQYACNSGKGFQAITKPKALALNRIQHMDTTISLTAEVRSKLKLEFQQLNTNIQSMAWTTRPGTGICTPLTNLMDPQFLGKHLTDKQKAVAYKYLSENDIGYRLLLVLAIQHSSDPSPVHVFTEMSKSWSQYCGGMLLCQHSTATQPPKCITLELATDQLWAAISSSAGTERNSSSFGFVQSRLGNTIKFLC